MYYTTITLSKVRFSNCVHFSTMQVLGIFLDCLDAIKLPSEILTSVHRFQHIKTNKLSLILRRRSLTKCNCLESDANPCSKESQCLNVLSFEECSDCPAKTKCQNKSFQLGERYKLETKHTRYRGIGLYSKEEIPEEKFIIEYVGEEINEDEYLQRMEQAQSTDAKNFYFFALGKKLYIDATFFGNNARYINHSCNPNARAEKWTVNSNGEVQTCIGIFSTRKIGLVN